MLILLVEDEPKIASFIKTGLEHERFAVDLASDGEEAMRKIGVNDYNAIVLDIMLPGRDGFEVCRHMRGMGITTPVLMLTAKSLTEDKITGLNLGGDDYLSKPFEFKELLARLHALLRREKILKPNILTTDDLELNTTAREVRRGKKIIKLGAKQFQMLEFLLRNKGAVCTRTMLLERVWGFNPTESNVLDVHMAGLKRKIDGGHAKKLIHTIYGRGYKITSENPSA